MSEAELNLTRQTIPVSFENAEAVQLDPCEAYGVISDLQTEYGVGAVETTQRLRAWLAPRLKVPPEQLDINAVAEFSDTIVQVVNGLVEHRKKKVTETASLLLSSLGCPPITDNGDGLKKSHGLRTSPASTPTGSDSTPSTTTTPSTGLKQRKRKPRVTAKRPKD